jgi:hypothetical protein
MLYMFQIFFFSRHVHFVWAICKWHLCFQIFFIMSLCMTALLICCICLDQSSCCAFTLQLRKRTEKNQSVHIQKMQCLFHNRSVLCSLSAGNLTFSISPFKHHIFLWLEHCSVWILYSQVMRTDTWMNVAITPWYYIIYTSVYHYHIIYHYQYISIIHVFVMPQVKEFLPWFATILDLIELDHLTVSGDVTFSRDVSLKVWIEVTR